MLGVSVRSGGLRNGPTNMRRFLGQRDWAFELVMRFQRWRWFPSTWRERQRLAIGDCATLLVIDSTDAEVCTCGDGQNQATLLPRSLWNSKAGLRRRPSFDKMRWFWQNFDIFEQKIGRHASNGLAYFNILITKWALNNSFLEWEGQVWSRVLIQAGAGWGLYPSIGEPNLVPG